VRGGTRYVPVKSHHTGKEGFLVYAPLPSTGWSLGVFYPRDELLASVNRLALVTAALGGGGFLALALLVAFIARGITLPLRRLTNAAREVAGGNLDAPLPELGAKDEVRELAESFGNMQTSLRDYIRDLTQATASRERMESELRIAHDIQMGILPKIFPPFPDRSEIDLFASLVPAREVGGDFYDFFPCGEDQFCFLIGDVSGKGVPAAFYMAVAKTLIKAVAESSNASGSRVTDYLPGGVVQAAREVEGGAVLLDDPFRGVDAPSGDEAGGVINAAEDGIVAGAKAEGGVQHLGPDRLQVLGGVDREKILFAR